MSPTDDYQDLKDRLRDTTPLLPPMHPADKRRLRANLMETITMSKNENSLFNKLAGYGALAVIAGIILFFIITLSSGGSVTTTTQNSSPVAGSSLDPTRPTDKPEEITVLPTLASTPLPEPTEIHIIPDEIATALVPPTSNEEESYVHISRVGTPQLIDIEYESTDDYIYSARLIYGYKLMGDYEKGMIEIGYIDGDITFTDNFPLSAVGVEGGGGFPMHFFYDPRNEEGKVADSVEFFIRLYGWDATTNQFVNVVPGDTAPSEETLTYYPESESIHIISLQYQNQDNDPYLDVHFNTALSLAVTGTVEIQAQLNGTTQAMTLDGVAYRTSIQMPLDGSLPLDSPLQLSIQMESNQGIVTDERAFTLAELLNAPPNQLWLKEVVRNDEAVLEEMPAVEFTFIFGYHLDDEHEIGLHSHCLELLSNNAIGGDFGGRATPGFGQFSVPVTFPASEITPETTWQDVVSGNVKLQVQSAEGAVQTIYTLEMTDQ